ncbi:MAG: hypothetical protein ACI8XO_000402 [Verrucomicrobiales bacterium]
MTEKIMDEENDDSPIRELGSDPVPDPPDQPAESNCPLPDHPGPVATFEALLKRPVTLVDALIKGDRPGAIVGNLLLTTIVCLGLFGVVVGTYSMGTQLWAAPLKIVVGMLVAGLICLPSLYIFSCLSGLDVKISTAVGVLFATICLTSLLLLGFAPVVWIFSQSINSIGFMGALVLLFWLIATYFGLGMINRTADYLGMQKRGHLVVWMGIFILVSLQMSTSLRPLVGSSKELFTSEKKFFLTHWSEQIGRDAEAQARDLGMGRSGGSSQLERDQRIEEKEEDAWE